MLSVRPALMYPSPSAWSYKNQSINTSSKWCTDLKATYVHQNFTLKMVFAPWMTVYSWWHALEGVFHLKTRHTMTDLYPKLISFMHNFLDIFHVLYLVLWTKGFSDNLLTVCATGIKAPYSVTLNHLLLHDSLYKQLHKSNIHCKKTFQSATYI